MESIGLYEAPVVDSDSDEDLNRGVIHLFNLDQLKEGGTVTLEDPLGTAAYEYRVSEVFIVEPDDEWAIDPVLNGDVVTLQTRTYPNGQNRIIVKADRV